MKISILLTALLVVSIFSFSFALADDAETPNAIVAESNMDSSEITTVANEYNNMAESDVRIVRGLNSVSLAVGWGVNSAKTEAEYMRGIWMKGFRFNISQSKVKEIREKYKGDKEGMIKALKEISPNPTAIATGRLHIGLGPKNKVYKLTKKEMTNNSVSFYVLETNADLQNTDNAISENIGTLVLDKTHYPRLDLWSGTLNLNSGEYVGKWNVEMSSRTRNFKHPVMAAHKTKEISKEKAKISEKRGTVKKHRGFFRRLFSGFFFWEKK